MSIYISKLNIWIKKNNIKVEKIDNTFLKTFNIVISRFLFFNKLKKTVLLANTYIKVSLKTLFLTFDKANLWFAKKSLYKQNKLL